MDLQMSVAPAAQRLTRNAGDTGCLLDQNAFDGGCLPAIGDANQTDTAGKRAGISNPGIPGP